MPTPRGIAVLAVAAVLLVAGLALGYRELVLLGAVGLLAVLLAAGWVGAPPRLAVDRSVRPDRVRRGDPSWVVVDVHSATGRTRVLEAEDVIASPHSRRRLDVPPLRVRGGTPARVTYQLPTDRRGIFTVGPLRVGRTDALGLCSASRPQGGTGQLVVRPRAYALRGVPVGMSPSLEGTVDAAVYGSITFHALREYRPGDDLRHVHWRTSARIGQMMVREHLDTALPRIAVVLDDRAGTHADPDEFEEMCDAAASVLAAAYRSDLPVELRLVSGDRPVEGAGPALDVLAGAAPVAGADLAVAVQRLLKRPSGDTIVLITGANSDIGPAGALRAAYSCVVVGILGVGTDAPVTPADVVVLAAPTASEFARRWDRVRRWS